MSNYASNSSIFSCEYKIPYDQSIAEHLEESQGQMNYIKVKLTEAFEKLEKQIEANRELEQQNHEITEELVQMRRMYDSESKQNNKLKQTFEVVLKNRKMMQEDIEELNAASKKKIAEKDQQINSLTDAFNAKVDRLTKENEEQTREIASLKSKVASSRQFDPQDEETALENQIKKITFQKVAETTRLRREIQILQDQSNVDCKVLLRGQNQLSRNIVKSQVNYGSENEQVLNKQNNGNHNNYGNYAQHEDSLGKWKKPASSRQQIQQSTLQESIIVGPGTNIAKQPRSVSVLKQSHQTNLKQHQQTNSSEKVLTDDQILTQMQQQKKMVLHRLAGMDRIKRPTPEERRVTEELEKQIYSMESNITRMKRKIRGKY